MGRNWNSMDLTLLTCNYNTPELVLNLLRSVKETCAELPKVIVMDTSTEESTLLSENNIPRFNFRSGLHGEAVNLGLKKVDTRYVLLVDSDVIFLQDYAKAFEKFKSSRLTLMGKVVGDCAGKQLYPRVEPWFCFIDTLPLKNQKIPFFDRRRHMLRHISNVDRIYDIGSTMFQDVTDLGLTVGDVDLEGKYFKHYGGMSWREQKYDTTKEDTDVDFGGTHPNKNLYDYALMIKETYKREVEHLKTVDIKGIFK